MRRAKAYSSSCSQVIVVYISIHFVAIHSFAAKNHQKITKNKYFLGSRSLKVIDVDISKKLVASACYDTQHVCAYLQLFSC